MERHSEAGTVGAGGKYKTVNIPSELRFEQVKTLVVCDGFHRYMDIISNFSKAKIASLKCKGAAELIFRMRMGGITN